MKKSFLNVERWVEPIAQQFIKTSLLNQENSTLWYMSFLT
jgi:hypothetical protein